MEWDESKLMPPQMMYQKDSGWLSSTKECNQVFDDYFVSKFEGQINQSIIMKCLIYFFTTEQLTSMELSFVRDKRMVTNCIFCKWISSSCSNLFQQEAMMSLLLRTVCLLRGFSFTHPTRMELLRRHRATTHCPQPPMPILVVQ